jgi:hypothetical protein
VKLCLRVSGFPKFRKRMFVFGATAAPPPSPLGQGLLIHKVSRSHPEAPHSVGLLRTGSLTQRPLSDNTQHSQPTDIHVPGGIRTQNISRQAALDLHLRQRGHCDRLQKSSAFNSMGITSQKNLIFGNTAEITSNFVRCITIRPYT